jgi:hypothetical protein
LQLEGGFDGLAGEFAGGGHGRGLDGGEDLPVRSIVGRLLELASQEQSLLDEQGFECRLRLERAAGHWRPSGCDPETNPSHHKLPESIELLHGNDGR